MVKIVDNKTVSQTDEPEVGDILIGGVTGNYYLVIDGGGSLLNLTDLRLTPIERLETGEYIRTNIRQPDITITFG